LWIVVSFAVLEAVTGTQSINISNKRHIIFIEFLISFTPLYILTIQNIKIFDTKNIVLKVYSISYSRLTSHFPQMSVNFHNFYWYLFCPYPI
jgi:hypothetical protein